MRSFNRTDEQARPVSFKADFTIHAPGSVLVSYGNTKVICTANIEPKVPGFLMGRGTGWLTAEYGMLPSATHTRGSREAARGKQSGRTQEIQRLIGRALRTCVNLDALGEHTLIVDCDVIQADGGTRTASISGGCLALILALWRHRDQFDTVPLINQVAALSIGLSGSRILVDLDYEEDAGADVDLNLVMNLQGHVVEIQATAEGNPFRPDQLTQMVTLGQQALTQIIAEQKRILLENGVAASWLTING